MAELVRLLNNHEGYFEVLDTLFSKGKRQNSRNGMTLEVENLVLEIANPVYAAPNGVRRGYNLSIGLVEGLQLVAGISDAGLTAQIQSNFRNYMEPDTGAFWGAYGPRTRDQLPIVVDRLAKDPETRQAVVTLWDPAFDTQGGKRDHPCTNRFSFLVRDGKLNFNVDMRSCDLYWGLPYDTVQFSMLHQTVANVLKLPVGVYTHKMDSAHLYEPHWDVAIQTLKERATSEKPFVVPHFTGDTWEEARNRAFTTYRAVVQTLPLDELMTNHERTIAMTLLRRRHKTLSDLVAGISR